MKSPHVCVLCVSNIKKIFMSIRKYLEMKWWWFLNWLHWSGYSFNRAMSVYLMSDKPVKEDIKLSTLELVEINGIFSVNFLDLDSYSVLIKNERFLFSNLADQEVTKLYEFIRTSKWFVLIETVRSLRL